MYICKNQKLSTVDVTIMEFHDVDVLGEYRMFPGVPPVQRVSFPAFLSNDKVIHKLVFIDSVLAPHVPFGGYAELLEDFIVVLMLKIVAEFRSAPLMIVTDRSCFNHEGLVISFRTFTSKYKYQLLKMAKLHCAASEYGEIVAGMKTPITYRVSTSVFADVTALAIPWDLGTPRGRRLQAEAKLVEIWK